jgi:hypothetical protein
VETRAVGGVQEPVYMQGSTSSVAGVFGGNFTSASVSLAPENQLNEGSLMANTMIAYSSTNRIRLYDYGTGITYDFNTVVPTFSNSATPTWSGSGDLLATSEFDAVSDSFQIFTYNSDGLARTMVTSGGGWKSQPAWSPVASRIAYVDAGNIYVMNSNGTGVTQLTTTPEVESSPTWHPSGNEIFYLREGNVWKMSAVGAGQAPVVTFVNTISSFDVDNSGARLAVVYSSGGSSIVALSQSGVTQSQLLSTTDLISGVSFAPTGSHLVFERDGVDSERLEILEIRTRQTEVLFPISSFSEGDPEWGPLPRRRIFIGTGGLFHTNAAGFLYSMRGNTMRSFLAFDAVTRSGVDVDVPPPSGFSPSHHFATITAADNITMLRYVNGFTTPRITISDPASPATAIRGAVVSWEQNTGLIASVAPFTRSRNGANPTSREVDGKVMFEGEFLGVWDGDGKKVSGAVNSLTRNETSGSLSPK